MSCIDLKSAILRGSLYCEIIDGDNTKDLQRAVNRFLCHYNHLLTIEHVSYYKNSCILFLRKL
jgi:hypothetical protein